MKKKFGNTRRMKNATLHRTLCLMAYTLNNTQPVICTLVADQPYFYMEEDIAPEDDDILGFENIDSFEQEILDLRKKIDAYDRMAKSYDIAPDSAIKDFQEEAVIICGAEITQAIDAQPVNAIIESMSQSRMAKSLMEFAQDNRVFFVESEQEQTARYDAQKNTIFINPNTSICELTMMAVRELRRHWQHRNGVMINPLTFHPDHAILVNRAQQADLTVTMIRAAWELQLAGEKEAWTYIENSHFSDLGRAFAREAFVDFRSLNNGKASSAAFESWFLSERCRHQDKKLIQQMLADHQGYVFQNTESSRLVSIDIIRALGDQPFGKNYLANHAQMIVDDPVFTEVRDRSNANFLWFVKFERSFQETEQALQSEGGLPSADNLSAQDPFITGKDDHETRQTIIQFNPNSRAGRLFNGDVPGSANVIHIQFGKGKGA